MSEPAPAVQVRPAATVMLVRDAPGRVGTAETGLEVLLLRRHEQAVFAADAWVFPGGGVDAADRDLEAFLVPGLSDAEASASLGLDSGGLAYWVAALRECFEESGLLLAADRATNRPLGRPDELTAARLARHRRDLLAGRRSFAGILDEEGLVLDVASLHPVSHWITPAGPPRRFDTRFFVAPAPAGQVAAHDTEEMVDSVWTSAAAVLARHAAGSATLVFPTIRQLEVLAGYSSVVEVMAAARSVRPSFSWGAAGAPDGRGPVLAGEWKRGDR